jgi:hypothetical protein
MEKIKPLEAEVFNNKNISIKKGIVASVTTTGVYVYDPKAPKNETPDCAEWFPFSSPSGNRCVVFGGE